MRRIEPMGIIRPEFFQRYFSIIKSYARECIRKTDNEVTSRTVEEAYLAMIEVLEE